MIERGSELHDRRIEHFFHANSCRRLPTRAIPHLATAEDANDLETTWQEWYQVLQETKQKMATIGMYLIDVTVDLDELDAYCQQRGLANIGG